MEMGNKPPFLITQNQGRNSGRSEQTFSSVDRHLALLAFEEAIQDADEKRGTEEEPAILFSQGERFLRYHIPRSQRNPFHGCIQAWDGNAHGKEVRL
jgi:hypothetical protein